MSKIPVFSYIFVTVIFPFTSILLHTVEEFTKRPPFAFRPPFTLSVLTVEEPPAVSDPTLAFVATFKEYELIPANVVEPEIFKEPADKLVAVTFCKLEAPETPSCVPLIVVDVKFVVVVPCSDEAPETVNTPVDKEPDVIEPDAVNAPTLAFVVTFKEYELIPDNVVEPETLKEPADKIVADTFCKLEAPETPSCVPLIVVDVKFVVVVPCSDEAPPITKEPADNPPLDVIEVACKEPPVIAPKVDKPPTVKRPNDAEPDVLIETPDIEPVEFNEDTVVAPAVNDERTVDPEEFIVLQFKAFVDVF